MDDGSARCLLDVINDPNALQEFLRSNSQDNGIHSKNSTSNALSGSDYGNHLLNTSGLRTTSISGALPANTQIAPVGSVTSLSNIHSSASPQNTFVNAVVNNNSVARTSGSTTASYNVGVVPSSVPLSSGVSFIKAPAIENALNKGGSTVLGMSVAPGSIAVAKPVVTSATASFQGKKPIPIQPKTPNASSAVTSSTVGSPGNRGRQVINSQKQSVTGQQSASPVGHRVTLNGIDSKANVKSNVVTGSFHTTKSSSLGNSQPILSSTTPVKRIAPKQPNILPQAGLSPPQMVGTQQKILLQQVSNQVTPQVSTGTIQQQNHTQLIQAQQLLNLIRSQNPTTQTSQQASPQLVQSQSPQLVQSQSLPANQIKQIQQLVQQKLSNQQQQPQLVQTVQQKVLTPAQLQVALKQNQPLTTQTVQAPQPQNIVVQEEVIKQLLQQVTQQKTAQHVIQQQPQLLQQMQQSGQKQILVQNVQPQSTTQGQQNTQLQVNISPQVKHSNIKQRTEVPAASPVNTQLQQKQVQQVPGQQQQVNLLPQQNIVITKDQGAHLLQGVTFVQNQPNKNSAAQVLNQRVVVQQAKPVLQQAKPSGTTPIVQVATTTQQNMVFQTQQQQAQNAGVQKVFIIKQPELLQKLGLQGTKTHQTIQITPQQLQALKQFQLQQQAVKQKLVSNNLQTGSSVQPKGLTADQLKQLQLQQQLQGSTVKQVVVQSRTQQPSPQQQRQVSVKTQGKMQHIPRILQTSGRQPVAQSIKVSVPVKQETNKGVKRPHSSDVPELPKAATRLKQGLTQDQQAVLRPDFKTPFTSHEDVVKRLTPYHVSYDPSPTAEDVQKADSLFSAVSTQLVKRSQKMMEKHRQLLFDESMRKHPSAEMVMLYRVFLTNERAALAEERKKAKENPVELLSEIKENSHKETASSFTSTETSKKDLLSSEHSSSLVTSTTENDFVSSMKNTVSEASSKISSLLNINISPPLKNSFTDSLSSKSGISSSLLPLSTRTNSSLVANSTTNHVSSSSPQEISSKHTAQLVNNSVDHSLAGEDFSISVDPLAEQTMDTESEKEDVTATLALLNSMASELDEVLDVEGAL